MGLGAGAFAAPVEYAYGTRFNSSARDLVAVDVDGDGYVDLATANQTTDSISVLLNNRDGTFVPHLEFAVGNRPLGLCAADFNGDGRVDLAATASEIDMVTLLPGRAGWFSLIASPVRSGQLVEGDALRFAGLGRVGSPPASYAWDFGDGRTSSIYLAMRYGF